MDSLHAGARWLFRLQAYRVLIFFGIFVVVWGFNLITTFGGGSSVVGFIFAVFAFLFFVILFSEMYARMSYNRWKYEFTKEALKIEHGIIWKKYTSLPYERIQNVDIRRGIIARMIGFSSLEIETAGQSGFGGGGGWRYQRRGNKVYHSEGYIPAASIEGAEKIREFILDRISKTHKTKQGI